jgi:hypothetical protein
MNRIRISATSRTILDMPGFINLGVQDAPAARDLREDAEVWA